MLSLGDFCIRFQDIDPDKPLPLERIEGIDSHSCAIRNRFAVLSSALVRDLIPLDNVYLPVVWDELIVIEHKIRFLTDCLAMPSDFGFLRNKGIVKIVANEVQTIFCESTPWRKDKYEVSKIETLNIHRLQQVDKNLIKLEEVHEFLLEAIQFVT